jgi:hypothetical protein
MPRGSLLLRKGPVRVIVGEPIPTAGLSETDRNQLLEKVRGVIARALAEGADPHEPTPAVAPAPTVSTSRG